MVQMLAAVAEREGLRHALVTLAKIRLDTFTLLSTVRHASSSSEVHAYTYYVRLIYLA